MPIEGGAQLTTSKAVGVESAPNRPLLESDTVDSTTIERNENELKYLSGHLSSTVW